MTNFIHYRNLLSRSPYSSDYSHNFEGDIATSDCNNYLPFYALGQHTLLDINSNIVVEYRKPSYFLSSRNTRPIRRYNDLLYGLGSNMSHVSCFTFKLQGIDQKVYYSNNIIYSQSGEILVCLGVDKEAVMNNSFQQLEDNNIASNYLMIINNKLFTDETYKNFSKKIKKEYIDKFSEANIDIAYTNDIDKWLFKNNFVKPEFKSTPKMIKHLNEEVPKILVE